MLAVRLRVCVVRSPLGLFALGYAKMHLDFAPKTLPSACAFWFNLCVCTRARACQRYGLRVCVRARACGGV
eukprot:4103441-Pleurochrysis_carterae.AAC.3